MNEDKPYRLPAPSVVADMLAQRAWHDDIDDDTRLLAEMGADTIRLLMQRCIVLARRNEQLEACK